MARNDVYLNINSLSPADAVVTGQQDMTAATIPELVLGDTPTFNFYFTDNTNVWPSWAGNAAYTLTWALSDAVAGDFAPAATTGNATPITGGWSVVLPLNSYDLVGLLNTKRVGQPYPVTNLWQQLRVTDPSGNEITRAMVWTPVRYRAISDTQNTESASPTGGRVITTLVSNALQSPTAAQFYAANPVPTSALGTAANGELLIGNGTGFTKATLTAGTGVAITNGSGSITIDATNAQELLTATVTNAEATPITKGQVVYIFGATGNRPSVKLAYNTGDATSAKTFGVVSDASISAGGTGTVTCVGVVDGLNLGTYNDGDTVYLGATPGSITATKPYAPNHLVYVGIIERANAGNGELYVRIQNGYELDEIHDVQITTPPASGSLLIRDNTLSLWKAATLTAGTNIAVTNGDAAVTVGLTGTVAVANGGTGVTTSTGTGSVVLSNTPTLTTPNIGAATGTSFNLTGSGTLGTTLTVNSTTDSSSKDTGAIVTEGGLGVEKSATFGGNLTVSGTGAFSNQVNTSGSGGGFRFDSRTGSGANWLWYNATGADARLYNTSGSGDVLTITNAGAATLAGNLTVSGTGTSSVAGLFDANAGLRAVSAASFGAATGKGVEMLYISTSDIGYVQSYDRTGSAYKLLNIEGSTVRINSGSAGNLLLGTTTDSSNGKLQLATHTTSAGGIGFGTDTALFRNYQGRLVLRDGSGGNNPLFWLSSGDTLRGFFYADDANTQIRVGPVTAGWSTVFSSGNNVVTLTLDGSTLNATFAGTVTATGGIVGTTTNDSAAAGNVGQYVSSTIAVGSAVSLTNATGANVTSISLTAGDWDVSGIYSFSTSGATVSLVRGGISTNSATFGNDDTFAQAVVSFSGSTGEPFKAALPTVRVSIASTTTVYFVAQSNFSAGTVAGFGRISARRVR